MYIVSNRVPVASGFEYQFEERFRTRAGQVERQPGFVRMEVLKPASPDTPYVVLTAWEDEAAFKAWVGSDDFREAHRNPLPREAFAGEGRLEQFEVIIACQAQK